LKDGECTNKITIEEEKKIEVKLKIEEKNIEKDDNVRITISQMAPTSPREKKVSSPKKYQLKLTKEKKKDGITITKLESDYAIFSIPADILFKEGSILKVEYLPKASNDAYGGEEIEIHVRKKVLCKNFEECLKILIQKFSKSLIGAIR